MYEIVEEASYVVVTVFLGLMYICLSGFLCLRVFRWHYQYQPVNHFVVKGQTYLVSLLLGLWEGILGQEVPYTRRVG